MPSDVVVSLPRMHDGQRQVDKNAARFNIMCCGRRWGKDVLLMRRTAKRSVIQRLPCAWFAPTYKMLMENWRTLQHRLQPAITRANEQERRIDLLSGGSIDFWSLDSPDGPRGRKYGYVAINEAAMVGCLLDTWNMVIRPTLADLRGGADFGSTPRGLNGFYTLWTQAAETADWRRFHFTTWENPYIPPDEVEAMHQALPERAYRQEILAEFVEDGAYFQGVDTAAIIAVPDKPEDHAGHYTVMGVDWAMSEDYTVLTVACRDCNRVVDWERFNQINFTYQRERLDDMAHRWNAFVLPERNSIGQPNIELLTCNVLPGPDGNPGFNTGATTKPALIQRLASAIERGSFRVPVEYADELRSYQVESAANGHLKFSAPVGMHDDRVMSLALAWWAISEAAARWYMS